MKIKVSCSGHYKKNKMHFSSQKPSRLVSLALTQNVTKLLQRAANELSLLPQVGGEESVSVADSKESGLESVLEGLGRTGGGGVGILDTSKLEETLNGGRGNETGTTGSGDKLG
jgi:hypothetical protein